MARLLLILPTDTYRTEDFVAAARRVGAEVVVASERAQALSGGDDFLRLDFRDPVGSARAVVELANRLSLDAVIPVDERGVLVAALAGQALGLVHNPPEAVAATRDKAEMRRRLDRAGVSQPDFALAQASDDVAAVAARLGLPCVVKPLSLSGSRGVIRADDPQAAAAAAARIRAILAEAGEDPQGVVLLERYVPGTEVAVEGLLRDGELDVLAIFDKPDPLEGPYFEETIYVTPSRLPAGTQRRIDLLAGEGAAALGLREGPLHAEVRLALPPTREGETQELWLLEVAARSIGGLCSRTLRFGLVNRSLEAILVRHALRMPLHDLRREEVSSGVMMLPIPAAGTLQEVRGREEALAVPGIVELALTIPSGRPVRPLPEGDRYLGFLFARGPTPEAVEASLRNAHSRLEVVIDP